MISVTTDNGNGNIDVITLSQSPELRSLRDRISKTRRWNFDIGCHSCLAATLIYPAVIFEFTVRISFP